MGQQVHWPVRADGADDRLQVAAQVWQLIIAQPCGARGVTAAAHVVGKQLELAGQLLDQRQPDVVVVRVTVHQQQRNALGVAPAVHRQLHTIACNTPVF